MTKQVIIFQLVLSMVHEHMVKIRLMRIGAKGRPFYRVVAVDERKKRTGSYLELLGTYNPLTNPKEINLKQDRIDEWVKNGAQLSDGFLRIIGKAKQRPARKPKKDRGNTASAAPAAAIAPAATPTEETTTEESAPVVSEQSAETEAASPAEETAQATSQQPEEEAKTDEAGSEESPAEKASEEEKSE
jgi:small subunit ribosomal protein S16